MSVGFSPETFTSIAPSSNNIFLFMVYFLVVYFILNIFMGAFVEMSRITGLMKGHVEDYKEIKLLKQLLNQEANKEEQKGLMHNKTNSVI